MYVVALAAGFQPDTRRALLLIPALVAVAAERAPAVLEERIRRLLDNPASSPP